MKKICLIVAVVYYWPAILHFLNPVMWGASDAMHAAVAHFAGPEIPDPPRPVNVIPQARPLNAAEREQNLTF
jgi:hypothetical protein